MNIYFKKVEEKEYNSFRQDVKEVFAIAVVEEFGDSDDGDVILDEDINESLFNPNAETYYIYLDDKKIGGVVLNINNMTQHNSLDLFYIYPDCHSKGIGQKVWSMIEEKYPKTKVWELVTPYFEKRNINFYVNKCGFHIVEFFNKYHKDPRIGDSDYEFKEEFFRFEKVMK